MIGARGDGGAPGVSTILRRCCIIDTEGLDTLGSWKDSNKHVEGFASINLLFCADWRSNRLLVLNWERRHKNYWEFEPGIMLQLSSR